MLFFKLMFWNTAAQLNNKKSSLIISMKLHPLLVYFIT